MDKKLEKYLQTVESELRGLEPQQREGELREMRQHLEAIVARLMEGGASEAEATEAAIAQFGAARTVGRELKVAGEAGGKWWRVVLAPLVAMACHGILYTAAMLLRDALYGSMYGPAWDHDRGFSWFNPTKPWDFAFSMLFTLGAPMAAGVLAGRIAGRQACWGVLGAYTTLRLLQGDYFILYMGAWVCAGAWLGSRRVNRRSQRRTDAQRT